MSGIAQGLAYLHAEGVVHGNLTTVRPLILYHVVPDLGQKKILIGEAGFPVISGYGLANLNLSGHSSKNSIPPPARFTAPEYFLNDQVLKNTVGDVYSFAMVALEVVTTLFSLMRDLHPYLTQIMSGVQPYHHLHNEHSVLLHILPGGRPSRFELDPLLVPDRLWGLLKHVWGHQPALRPDMNYVVLALQSLRCVTAVDA